MNKETYFEMCEALGTEPVEEEIPVEFSDFPILLQQVMNVYNYLPDNWDPMGGNYLGKNLTIVYNLFDTFFISDIEKPLCLELITYLDIARRKILNKKENKKPPTP